MNNLPIDVAVPDPEPADERAAFQTEFDKLGYLWSESNQAKAFVGWQLARARQHVNLPPLLTDERINQLATSSRRCYGIGSRKSDAMNFARVIEAEVHLALARQMQIRPLSEEAKAWIGKWVTADMDQAVQNGASSVSMPDHLVEIAAWLGGVTPPEVKLTTRQDGMSESLTERHLRRLLAVRVGMPNTYYDDGEAQGSEHGISIDFMREPVAEIDFKLRALNLARAEAAPVVAQVPLEWRDWVEGVRDDILYPLAHRENDELSHIAEGLGQRIPNLLEMSAPEAPAQLNPAYRVAPVDPTLEMIDAGAQRLVSWGENSTWPDSWDALQVEAARTEADRCYRSMILVAPGPEAPAQAPIGMVLHCPACGMQHIDAPKPRRALPLGDAYGTEVVVEAEWTNPPHRSHLCHGCGHIWRPADVPTNGVAAVKTKGRADSPAPEAPAQAPPSAVEVGRGDVVAFEFYNRATGHAIVDYSVNTHVGNLSAAKGYEARPLVYAAPRQNVLDGSKLIPAWQAREALDELEAAARGDAPFNHQAAAVVRAALSHKEQP